MSEPHFVPVFSKFSLQEMIDHAPNPWLGGIGWLLARLGLIKAEQGSPAPGPVAEDLAPFDLLPEAFQPRVADLVQTFEALGFSLLSHMHNPLYPNVAGAYLLHQNQQWVAFVACVKEVQLVPGGPARESFREVFSLLGFREDGQVYSVTTAPFLQVPHVKRIFLRKGNAAKVLKRFEQHVQGQTLRHLQGLPEVQKAMDWMSDQSHQSLVARGVRKAVPAPRPEPDPTPQDEEQQP